MGALRLCHFKHSRFPGSGLGASPARGPASGMGAGPFSVMDSSNFPSLNPNPASSRYGVMSAPQYGGPMGVASAYGLGPDGSGGNAGQPQNFSIQNEDFPALPGSGPGAPPSRPGVGGLQSHQFGASSSSLRDESGSSGGGQGGAIRGNLSAAIVGSSRASNATPQAQSAPQGASCTGFLTSHSLFNICRDTSPSGTQQAGSRAAMGGLGGGATGMQLQQLMNSVETDESSGSATRPKDTKYGLLGLLDVIKMTDRVLFKFMLNLR